MLGDNDDAFAAKLFAGVNDATADHVRCAVERGRLNGFFKGQSLQGRFGALCATLDSTWPCETWRRYPKNEPFSAAEREFIDALASTCAPSSFFFNWALFVHAREFELMQHYDAYFGDSIYMFNITTFKHSHWYILVDQTLDCDAIAPLDDWLHSANKSLTIVLKGANRRPHQSTELLRQLFSVLLAVPRRYCTVQWDFCGRGTPDGAVSARYSQQQITQVVLHAPRHSTLLFELLARYYGEMFWCALRSLDRAHRSIQLVVQAEERLAAHYEKIACETQALNDTLATEYEIAMSSYAQDDTDIFANDGSVANQKIDIAHSRGCYYETLEVLRRCLQVRTLQRDKSTLMLRYIVARHAGRIAAAQFSSDLELASVVALLVPEGLVAYMGDYVFNRICTLVYQKAQVRVKE